MARTPLSSAFLRVGCVLAVIVVASVTLAAQQAPAATWLASSTYGAAEDRTQLGRLVMKDGTLTYFGARGEWTTPLAEITRLSPVRGSDHLFDIETVSGRVLRLSIVGPQMLNESPKKAIRTIQRALRPSAPPPF